MGVRRQRESLTNAEILFALGAKRVGKTLWVCRCPAHDDHSPSLSIYDKGDHLIFVCGRCDWRDVREALKERGLTPPSTHRARSGRGGSAARAPSPAALPPAPDFSALALAIWHESVPAIGTVVERYLVARKLEAALSDHLLTSVLRFHPRCPRGRGHEMVRVPAMVALMRRVEDDEPVAVHRTFLNRDATRDGKRMMLGSSSACAVKLCGDVPFAEVLHVAEGIESGLAAMLLGYCPLWAMGSAGAIETMPIRDDIGKLIVCGDRDDAGYKAAMIAAARYDAAGHEAEMVWPDRVGDDFADQVMRR